MKLQCTARTTRFHAHIQSALRLQFLSVVSQEIVEIFQQYDASMDDSARVRQDIQSYKDRHIYSSFSLTSEGNHSSENPDSTLSTSGMSLQSSPSHPDVIHQRPLSMYSAPMNMSPLVTMSLHSSLTSDFSGRIGLHDIDGFASEANLVSRSFQPAIKKSLSLTSDSMTLSTTHLPASARGSFSQAYISPAEIQQEFTFLVQAIEANDCELLHCRVKMWTKVLQPLFCSP